MTQISEIFEGEIQSLGEDAVEKSLLMHRNLLEETSNEALLLIKDDLPVASFSDKVKAYDTTRRHLNTLDGRADSAQQNIIIIPGELAKPYDLTAEINEQITCQKSQNKSLSSSTQPKQKLLKTPTASE